MQTNLQMTLPGFRIKRNTPYRGTSDGLATALRKKFGTRHYAGIEIEINQKALHGAAPRVSPALIAAMQGALAAR
jgi:hypothetical protein